MWSLISLCGAIAFISICTATQVVGGEASFENCYARWSETNLVIGNTHIERTWQICDGLLTAISFRDLDAGVEWLAKASDHPAPSPAGKIVKENRKVSIYSKSGRCSPVEAESMVVEMTATGRQSWACFELTEWE